MLLYLKVKCRSSSEKQGHNEATAYDARKGKKGQIPMSGPSYAKLGELRALVFMVLLRTYDRIILSSVRTTKIQPK